MLAFDNVLTRVNCPGRRIGRLCITCCLWNAAPGNS